MGNGGSDIGSFLQYGVLGLVIVAILLGWFWAKPAVDRLIADKEKAELQRDELLKVYEDKVMPALAQSSQVLGALTPVMHDVLDVIDDVRNDRDIRSRPSRRRDAGQQ